MTGTPVTLHIYDVSTDSRVGAVNQYLDALGTGAFHGGVEVNGEEWSYGYSPDGTGVFKCPPKGCTAHKYRESLDMGTTTMTNEEIGETLSKMKGDWPGFQYDLLRKNCVIFSSTFIAALGSGPAPPWISNLASAGATLQDGFFAGKEAADKAAILVAAKAGEFDAKYDVSGTFNAGAKDVLERAGKFDDEYKLREKAFKGAVIARAKAKEVADSAAQKADAIKKEADDDGDGEISWEEAQDYIREKAGTAPDIFIGTAQQMADFAKQKAAEVHKVLDKDGDGTVTLGEVTAHAKEKAAELHKAVDKDGDGKITKEEAMAHAASCGEGCACTVQ